MRTAVIYMKSTVDNHEESKNTKKQHFENKSPRKGKATE